MRERPSTGSLSRRPPAKRRAGGIPHPSAVLLPLLAGCLASPAAAEEARALCADRPGLGTPACTVARGAFVAEMGLLDWTRETDAASRTDTISAGSLLIRAGLTDTLEAQLGWEAFGHIRTRDRASGALQRMSRVGDVTVALRRNLRNPDGSGVSTAVMAYATLPTGRQPVGAGDWGAGLLVPLGVALDDSLSLAFTPQIDAAVDGDGKGRHLGFGGVAGLSLSASDRLGASVELSLYRDRDPAGAHTLALTGLSASWQPNESTQFDIGVNIGLNAAALDRQLYFGIATRF